MGPYLSSHTMFLKFEEIPFFYKALSRLFPQGLSFLSIFKNSQYQTRYVMTSRGPYTLPFFPSSHHERRLCTIEVQLRPYPRTWPLLPYPRVSNANTIPMKSPEKKIIKRSIRMHQEQVKIPPNQTQHTSNQYKEQLNALCMIQA